jgi:hypothetical protein
MAENLTNLAATAPIASATTRALNATFFINHGEILANGLRPSDHWPICVRSGGFIANFAECTMAINTAPVLIQINARPTSRE